MGVTGLWKLIESSGKPIPLETLENKVLAIDISIWLHQVVKGYQDNKGGQLHNAHLLGLFNRICKLLYFRIKPVFVFDGQCPELKRQTIAKRSQEKTKIQGEADRLEHLLLESLAKEMIVKQALGDPEMLNLSPPKLIKLKPTRTEQRDEMFVLPPLKEESKFDGLKTELEEEDDDEDFCPKRSYDVNINKIDVTSSHFMSLPADIRHDILTDIKDTRKQNSWGRLRELPVESNDFSSYQMSRLIRRRQVQIGLEAAEKEMGGKTWSLSELESMLSEDGVVEASNKHAQRIASNEHARFVLVRDIAKATDEAKKNHAGPSTSTSFKPATTSEPSTSKQAIESEMSVESEKPVEILDDEDFDLQRAIQLSLGNDPGDVIKEATEVSDGRIKLNPEQRQKFSGAIKSNGLLRGFMMEYAEMNDDDINELMEATQVQDSKEIQDSLRLKFPNTDDYVLYGTPKKNKVETAVSSKTQDVAIMSDSDDDLVEITEKVSAKSKVVFTIEADLKNFSAEDDLFADIFDTSANKSDTEDVPDVEVASISSDDDTIPYDLPEEDLQSFEIPKEVESGFVSEDNKGDEDITSTSSVILEADSSTRPEPIVRAADVVRDKPQAEEEDVEPSENEKFWAVLDDIVEPIPTKSTPELSENEKFYADEIPAEIIELDDEDVVPPAEKTPVKKDRENSPPPAKVSTPFFANRKTPSSKKKQQEEATTSGIARITVSKSLFPEAVVPARSAIELAADALRTTKTAEELQQMRNDLNVEQVDLSQERNKRDRQGASITDTMSRECKDLLRLFGIPYVNSPMEAEAQCAFLNTIQLTDGTISDDSDIWLFGGQTVYKNFFVQKKMVMEFRYENIDQMFHLDRKKLIQLAMLVGSDYTTGINGIGAVTALEILAAFPPTSEVENETDQYQSLVSSLRKFREWFQTGKQSGPGGKTILKSKLKNIVLFEGFPSLNVAKAYLEPTVDTNAEKFTWGMPDTESLVEFAKSKLGWTRFKTEELLTPVIKRMNEKKQSTIKDYFKSQVGKKFFDNQKMSKRVQKAVGKIGGVDEPEEEKPKRATKRKAPVKRKQPEVVDLSDGDGEQAENKTEADDESVAGPSLAATKTKPAATKPKPPVTKRKASAKKVQVYSDLPEVVDLSIEDDECVPPEAGDAIVAGTSSGSSKIAESTVKKPAARKRQANAPDSSTDETPMKKQSPRIPESKQVIPQREKDKEEQDKAKQKAIELFKKSKSGKR